MVGWLSPLGVNQCWCHCVHMLHRNGLWKLPSDFEIAAVGKLIILTPPGLLTGVVNNVVGCKIIFISWTTVVFGIGNACDRHIFEFGDNYFGSEYWVVLKSLPLKQTLWVPMLLYCLLAVWLGPGPWLLILSLFVKYGVGWGLNEIICVVHLEQVGT